MNEGRPEKQDRRIRKTRKLLLHGLTQLMEKKSIKHITVRELTDLCDLNRATFYLHYRNVLPYSPSKCFLPESQEAGLLISYLLR